MRDESGGNIAEYVLILAVIVSAAVAGIRLFWLAIIHLGQ
jgi:Flp pilus assembly pilin Flp